MTTRAVLVRTFGLVRVWERQHRKELAMGEIGKPIRIVEAPEPVRIPVPAPAKEPAPA
jgi:hypothetical protein